MSQSARTLRPRDLDPRTLRVVRRVLAELRAELDAEYREWANDNREELDYASGIASAAHDIEVVENNLRRAESLMRARLRRRKS